MKTMWIFICCSTNLKACFDSYEKVEAFKKMWFHEAVENDWGMEEDEDWCIHKIIMNPENVKEFYLQNYLQNK